MEKSTEPIVTRSSLIRLDRDSGILKEREYFATIVSGPEAGKSLPLKTTLSVGSHPGAGLCLSDTTVSRYHFELQPRPDGVRVRDLESRNGTFIQGARIQEAIVEQETVVTAGKTSLRISVVDHDVAPSIPPASFGAALGRSPAMRRLFSLLEKVAPTDSTIVLLGETGTGKEVLAEAIHRASSRATRPFVVIDCGAIAPTLIESELFGHVRGSFTGAVSDRKGAFLEAEGGTVFLDEIGELPLELQPKLLRVLESGTVKRIGEDKQRTVDVRVVAATHRDLQAEAEAERFRQDLYFRLSVVPLQVPSLRERLDDVPLLIEHFAKSLGRPDFQPSAGLLERLRSHAWPGNVRELRNVVERVLAGADLLFTELPVAVPSAPGAPSGEVPFKEAKEQVVEAFTRDYLAGLLQRCNGNISEAARVAGIGRTYLHRLVAKYGLKANDS